MPQCDKWDPKYWDKKTTPTETEYGEMIEELKSDIYDIGIFDNYIGVAVKLDNVTNSGGNIATVKRRAKNANRFAIGRAHKNSLLDTRDDYVELEGGTTYSYFSNVIADNVYSKLDSEGHQTVVMSDILDHQRDGTVVIK